MSCRRALRLMLSLAAASLLAVGGAVPAGAHPFGPPPSAIVSARGHSVFIEWRAAPDDGIAVGVEVGLLDERLIDAYLEAPAQAAGPEHEEEALTASPELRAYLLDHIQVEQDGTPCRGTVQPMGNFVREGARLVHQCPAEIATVTVRITMLHERHEAYRTFAIAADGDVQPGEAVFTVTAAEHTFDFTGEATAEPAAAAGGGASAWWPVLAVGGLVLVAGGTLALRGRA